MAPGVVAKKDWIRCGARIAGNPYNFAVFWAVKRVFCMRVFDPKIGWNASCLMPCAGGVGFCYIWAPR